MSRRWIRTWLTASTLVAAPNFAPAADEPAVRPDHAALFKRLDADGNGQLSKDEVPEEQQRLLERLMRTSDKNGDGKLTEAEFAAGLSEERPRGDAPPGAPGGRPGQPNGQFDPGQIFRNIDRNGDGKVTKDEIPEERRDRFQEMLARGDADKDGALNLDEFRRSFGGPGPVQPGRPGGPGQPGMPPIPGAGLMAAVDVNRDGELSTEEIEKAGDALKKLDRDGDGKLTQRELFPPRPEGEMPSQPGGRPDPERMLAFFKQQDKNGDGKLSKDEVGERMRENFDNLDGNGDGLLDDVELRQMVERFATAGQPDARRRGGDRPEGPRPEGGRPPEGRRPEAERRSDGERRPEGRSGEGERRPDPAEAERRFKEADKDGDGFLGKDELPERAREHFAEIDSNGDGKVSRDEMREAMRRVMERREQGRPDGGRPEGDRRERRGEGERRERDQPANEKGAGTPERTDPKNGESKGG